MLLVRGFLLQIESFAVRLQQVVSDVVSFKNKDFNIDEVYANTRWLNSQTCQVEVYGIVTDPWQTDISGSINLEPHSEYKITKTYEQTSLFESKPNGHSFLVESISHLQPVKFYCQVQGLSKQIIIQPPFTHIQTAYSKRGIDIEICNPLDEFSIKAFHHDEQVYESINGEHFDRDFVEFLFDELVDETEIEVQVFDENGSLFFSDSVKIKPPEFNYYEINFEASIIHTDSGNFAVNVEFSGLPHKLERLEGYLQFSGFSKSEQSIGAGRYVFEESINNVQNKSVTIDLQKIDLSKESFKVEVFEKNLNLRKTIQLENNHFLNCQIKDKLRHINDDKYPFVELSYGDKFEGTMEIKIIGNKGKSSTIKNYAIKGDDGLENVFTTSLTSLRRYFSGKKEEFVVDKVFRTRTNVNEFELEISVLPFGNNEYSITRTCLVSKFQGEKVKCKGLSIHADEESIISVHSLFYRIEDLRLEVEGEEIVLKESNLNEVGWNDYVIKIQNEESVDKDWKLIHNRKGENELVLIGKVMHSISLYVNRLKQYIEQLNWDSGWYKQYEEKHGLSEVQYRDILIRIIEKIEPVGEWVAAAKKKRQQMENDVKVKILTELENLPPRQDYAELSSSEEETTIADNDLIETKNQPTSFVDIEAEEFDKNITVSDNKINDKQIHSTSEMLPSEEDSNDMPTGEVEDAEKPSKISKSAKDNTAKVVLNSNQIKPTRGRKKNPTTNSRSETKNIEKPEDVPKQDFDKYKYVTEELNRVPQPKRSVRRSLERRKVDLERKYPSLKNLKD